MKKTKLLLAAAALMLGGSVWAQTDVTSTYIANPSFELTAAGTNRTSIYQATGTIASDAIYGWTLTQGNPNNSYENVNITDNTTSNAGFGTAVDPADGTYYFFNRRGWAQVTNSLKATSLSNLSAGTYFLSVKYKAAYSDNNGESSGPVVTVKAVQNNSDLASRSSINGPKSPGNTYFNESGWQTIGVQFTVSEAGSVDFVISYSLDGRHGRGDVLLDDVRLYNLSAATSSDPADITGWISNSSFENNTFTGTQADGSSIGSSGGTLNIATGWTYFFNIEGWRDCSANITNPADGKYCMNAWFGTINEMKFYQTIGDLPEGVYEISAQVRTDQTETTGIYTYGIAGGNTYKSSSWDAEKKDDTWNSMENWQTLTARASIVGSGSLQFGLRTDKFVQFDDFHLTYLGNDLLLTDLKSAFTTLQATATTDLGSATYTNVTGSERTALTNAKNATPEETVEAWNEAVTTLSGAIDAFEAAKDSYDGLVAARTTGATYTSVLWPRASTTKKEALDDALAAATTPSNAADAATKANAIVTAYRQFVESNGIAEGVDGAINFASDIAGADPDVNTGWTSGIGVDNRDAEKYTDGSGNTSGKYYDGGWANNAGVSINMTRELTLPAGTYQLQVTARGSSDLTTYTMSIGGKSVDLPKEGAGAATGTFGHGWSDKYVVFDSDGTPLTLAINATSSEYYQWISFNRFRLYSLTKVTESVTVTTAGYATYASDHALDFTDSDIMAYIAKTKGDGTGVTFERIKKVPANTGVLLYKVGGDTESIPVFNGTGADDVADNVFVRGTGATVETEVGDYYNYILNKPETKPIGFYRANGQTVAANRAYIRILKTEADIKEFIALPGMEDDADGISLTPALSDGEGEIYNLAGQRMNKMQKGINIVNGKKVLF